MNLRSPCASLASLAPRDVLLLPPDIAPDVAPDLLLPALVPVVALLPVVPLVPLFCAIAPIARPIDNRATVSAVLRWGAWDMSRSSWIDRRGAGTCVQ